MKEKPLSYLTRIKEVNRVSERIASTLFRIGLILLLILTCNAMEIAT